MYSMLLAQEIATNNVTSGFWRSFIQQDTTVFSLGLFLLLLFWSIKILMVSKNSHSARMLPNLWTGAGVGLTFVSLIFGFADINLNKLESEEVSKLIVVLANAFVTSIVGLLGAQMITFILSFSEDKKEKKEYFVEPPEKLLFDLKNNSFAQNNSIIDALNTLNGSLLKIDRRLEESSASLVEKFDDTMKAVSQSVKQNISEINQDMFKQISGVLAEFKEISKDAGSHFMELNQNNVSIIAAEMKTLMKSLSDEVSKMQKAISEENEAFVKTQKEAVASQQEKNEEFQKTSLERSNTLLNDQIAQFSRLTEKLVSLSEAQQKQQNESWNKSSEDQREAIQTFLGEISNITEIAKSSTAETQKSYEETLKTINSNVEEVLGRLHSDFEKVSKELKDWAASTELGINATSERLKESINAFDDLREIHLKLIDQTQDQLEMLQKIVEGHRGDNQKFEQYESRTNELSGAIIQMTELSEILKELTEINKRVNV